MNSIKYVVHTYCRRRDVNGNTSNAMMVYRTEDGAAFAMQIDGNNGLYLMCQAVEVLHPGIDTWYPTILHIETELPAREYDNKVERWGYVFTPEELIARFQTYGMEGLEW